MASSVLTPERVIWHKRTRFNPLKQLTPERLSQYLDGFRAGTLKEMAYVMDVIEERDDIIRTVSMKRKKDVSRLPWSILTVESEDEGGNARAEEHKKVLESFFNHLTVTNALDENERGGVRLLVRQMMDAVGKRYAVHEVVWKPQAKRKAKDMVSTSDTGSLSAELRFVPLWFFESETGRLRFLPDDNAIAGVPMDEGAWMVTVGDGVMVACSIAYMYKRLPMTDWLTYCERHGMPLIRGKTSATPGSEEWERMEQAVANICADSAAVMSEGEVIEAIDLKGSGELPYPAMVERMDRVLTSLWRGADLSTMSAGTGKGQGASVQAGETDLLLADDAEWISESINMSLVRQVIAQVFGEEPLAYFKITPPEPQNVDSDIKIDTFLEKYGARLSRRDALERYGRSEADAGEPVLELAEEPAMPGAPPKPGQKPKPKPAANTAPSGSIDTDFQDLFNIARDRLAKAQANALAPLRETLEAALRVPDEGLNESLREVRRQLPDILARADRSKVANVFEETAGAAVLSGLTYTPEGENQIQNIKPEGYDFCDCQNIYIENLNCKKGCQCGKSCIVRSKECKKDAGAMPVVQADSGPLSKKSKNKVHEDVIKAVEAIATKLNPYVRISEVGEKLDIAPSKLESIIKEMISQEGSNLSWMGMDDPLSLNKYDRLYAIDSGLGKPRTHLFIKGKI
ncbi:MAG TPA: DUF935 family protein [Candidatus Methylacidiphilales bacterium]|nr:DUF935 family protein [Candidatus Methylacidiphilales bacterium]